MAQLPTDPMAAMREFIAAGEAITGHMKKAALHSRTGEDRALLEELLGQIESQRGELETTLPGVFQAAQGRLDGALTRLEKLRTKKDELLAKAESLSLRMGQKISSGRDAIKKDAEKPKPAPPRPKFRRPDKSKAPAFLPGKSLRDWLLPTEAPKESSTPHTHGNIWDNWKAVPPPLPLSEGNEEYDEGD